MGKELKDQRIPVMFSKSELKIIDDWRFENRVGSRAEAIRRLCRNGLDGAGKGDVLEEQNG